MDILHLEEKNSETKRKYHDRSFAKYVFGFPQDQEEAPLGTG